jgi:hypothetical protein
MWYAVTGAVLTFVLGHLFAWLTPVTQRNNARLTEYKAESLK